MANQPLRRKMFLTFKPQCCATSTITFSSLSNMPLTIIKPPFFNSLVQSEICAKIM